MLNNIINKQYKLKVLNSLLLREKIMKDNNLSELDILDYFYLQKDKDIIPTIKVEDAVNIDSKSKIIPKYEISAPFIKNMNPNMLKVLNDKHMINTDIVVTKKIKACVIEKDKKDIFADSYKTEEVSSSLQEYCDEFNLIRLDKYKKNNEISSDYYENAIENSFVVINETKDGKYQLVDGFYRLLYKKINRDVIVKIYNNLSDEEWLKLMISCNAWKLNDKSVCKFFDRGFILGLCNRFNIDKNNYISYRYDYDIIKELKNFVSISNFFPIFPNIKDIQEKEVYETIYDKCKEIGEKDILLSKFFINDFKALGDIFNYIPNEEAVCEKGSVIVFSHNYNKFLNKFLACFVYIRNTFTLQKEFSLDIYKKILQEKEISKILKKTYELSIPGYVDNHLNKNIIKIYNTIKDCIVI